MLLLIYTYIGSIAVSFRPHKMFAACAVAVVLFLTLLFLCRFTINFFLISILNFAHSNFHSHFNLNSGRKITGNRLLDTLRRIKIYNNKKSIAKAFRMMNSIEIQIKLSAKANKDKTINDIFPMGVASHKMVQKFINLLKFN